MVSTKKAAYLDQEMQVEVGALGVLLVMFLKAATSLEVDSLRR